MTLTGLTADQKDRAAGVLLGQAIGDALGVPYEFGPLLPEDERPVMRGGGLGSCAAGEYSDDTQMAVCVANASALGVDLRSEAALDSIAEGFLRWYRWPPPDMGNLTARVLSSADSLSGTAAARCRKAALSEYERSRSAFGNGALMRTAPVALFALLGRDGKDGREATAQAAREIACLTHADPRAGDACVLWCEAIRVAVLEGRFDLAAGLDLLPAERDPQGDDEQPADPRAWWAGVIEEATNADWRDYRGLRNGATHTSLKVAWSAIVSTQSGAADADGSDHVRRALEACVHVGHDTDTTAAIAGGLLGARYGLAGMPGEWWPMVNGWSGLPDRRQYRAEDLARLSLQTALGGLAGQDDEEILRRVARDEGAADGEGE